MPRRESRLVSKTMPSPGFWGSALNSFTSASNSIKSSSCSTFVPCFAEISTDGILPPHDSTSASCSANSFFTFSGLDPGTSILFIATMKGIFDFLMCSITSMVWGLTPSSAATTKIAMSAALAPRALNFENASWPGVSKNVIFRACPELVEGRSIS